MLSSTAFTALCLLAAVEALPYAQNQNGIDWQPCPELNQNITILNDYQGTPFDCATLSVPYDYTDPNSEPLELSLFRVNATKEPVLGSVLINFGGPGGTGAENLPVWATQMAANIGEQWNLLSWDPRGTGHTIPFICNISEGSTPSKNLKRSTSGLFKANLTEHFEQGGWDLAGSIAEFCYAAMNETGQYIGTAFTARDMMQIVDALNEDGLLRYYGWSYGTALGSYVSAMFPDRIERVVLDGNINPHDYQSGTYGDFLIDANKAFTAFLQECLDNKANCSLAQYTNANSTDDMFAAIDVLLEPVAANGSTSDQAWNVYSAAQSVLYGPLYYPAQWPTLADTITEILNGTYNASASTGSTTNSSVASYNPGSPSNTIGIRASDAIWRTNSSAEYLPTVEYQANISWFNQAYPSFWISARWLMNAKEQYKGDFNVTTRHPILYVNGEYDPVCPLANAYNASQSFHGSVVLPHSGYGHGIVVDPSACVASYVQAYFANGTMPEAGAHCKPDLGPWQLAAAGAL